MWQLLGIIAIGFIATATALADTFAVRDLRCEHREDPLSIDVTQPRLSWKLESDVRGQRQSAYRVLVASTAQQLEQDVGDLWDSGRVASEDTIQVRYAGRALEAGAVCFWKVQSWPAAPGDAAARPSAWSAAAKWEMGLLKPGDWTAKWIAEPQEATAAPASQPAPQRDAKPDARPMPLLRRAFNVTRPIRRARAYACGLGQFELRLNGAKVGNDVIEPGWTDYRDTCLYVAHDVTAQLKQGENVIGATLGNGMYHVPKMPGRYSKFNGSFGPRKMIAQLRIDYEDGSTETIASDASWKVASGPVTFSHVYGGEDHDARLEPTGWDAPRFDDANWAAAQETTGPGGALAGASRSAPPLRVMEVFKPIKVTQPTPGVWVYDLGQNASIIPRITLQGAAGSAVRITPGELLKPDGTVSQDSMGRPAWMTYTLRGSGEETWSPRFYYVGSRYLQVEGAVPADAGNPSSLPVVREVVGQFITSNSAVVGEFACSNELFNRTATLIRWAMRSNMVSVLTDCPHREKLGWLEQSHLVGPSLMSNFDARSLFNKIAGDMRDSQTPEGLVPDIAPEITVFGGGFRDSPEWGSACILIPWQVYEWYGDLDVLRVQYDTMTRYVGYLGGKAKDGILSHGLGDWYDLGPKPPGVAQLTPIPLTATAFYYRDLTTLARIARLLGKEPDAEKWERLAAQVREAFNAKFYDAARHTYATSSQTANAIPLVFGLAPEADRAAIMESLVADVRQRDNGLTAGDVGYRFLLRALADGGRSDVIFDMNSRSDRPGYGYILNTGATSLTEGWDGSSSQNHFMLGHIMEWFYSDLAGIRPDPDDVGFRKVHIRPTPVGDVTWARASYESVRGRISSSWRLDGEKFTLDVKVPPGVTATVHVPSAHPATVTEGGVRLAEAAGVRVLLSGQGPAVCEVGSGEYRFTSTLKPSR